ncbi:MAG: TldD/PmbA family protein [Clostridium sp.]|uniref:TldD/PmbA family protein n=1 Tax=Clostridium sp. TaxID=1506 RepID=UPI002FCB0D7A
MGSIDIRTFTEILFEKGKKLGFEDMEVYYTGSDSFDIKVYKSEIDSYNVNSSMGLSFRGIINGKMTYSFTERFNEDDIDYLLNLAVKNSNEVEIIGEDHIFEGSDNYHSEFSNNYSEVDSAKKIQDAILLEKKGSEIDNRIETVQHCMLQTAKGTRRIINTKGLDLSEESGVCMAYISVVASDGESKKSGSSFNMVESYGSLDFDAIAKEAVEEATIKIGAVTPKTGKYKIILRYDAAAELLSTFAGVFSAESVQKGLSLLKDKLNTKIACDKITIIDNPFLECSASKTTFDDEGVATKEKCLIEKGILKTYLHNLKTSKKDGVESTGNGFKSSYKAPVDISPTNLYIQSGERNLEDIISELDSAIMITELQGLHSGANSVSGDFSLAALGMYIENGKVVGPVEQMTISGNFYSLLRDVVEVANDFKLSVPTSAGGVGSSSILIKEMNISGK